MFVKIKVENRVSLIVQSEKEKEEELTCFNFRRNSLGRSSLRRSISSTEEVKTSIVESTIERSTIIETSIEISESELTFLQRRSFLRVD